MRYNMVLFLVMLLFSCNIASDTKKLQVIKELVPNKDFSNETIVLIIPFDGCSTCFFEATKLIPRVVENSGIVIIPNRHKKRIDFFLKENKLEDKGIVIDSLQKTTINKIVNINPVIYVIKENRVYFSSIIEYSNVNDIIKQVLKIRQVRKN